jgi:hypothetical protein
MSQQVLNKPQGRGDAPGRRTVESGKLLLQRYLAAHGRLCAGVHLDDALMEVRDLRFARGEGLAFQRNLPEKRGAEALISFGASIFDAVELESRPTPISDKSRWNKSRDLSKEKFL